jgi:hypothetical protein
MSLAAKKKNEYSRNIAKSISQHQYPEFQLDA